VTQTARLSDNTVAAQVVQRLKGLGQLRRQETLT
jgi:hypothetical protein